MFHVTDWFTTMLGFAGGNIDALDVDGVDQWDTLVNGGSTCASKTTQRFINKIISQTRLGITVLSCKIMKK